MSGGGPSIMTPLLRLSTIASLPRDLTGQLVVEYYLATYGAPSPALRWAIAGRSGAKLEAVKQALAAKFPEAAVRACVLG